MKHIKSLYAFLFESRNLNVKNTGREEKNIENRRNTLMDVLLKIYEIFEGNPQIVIHSSKFKFRDFLKEYNVSTPSLTGEFIFKHFLNADNRTSAGTYYSLKSKNLPNWKIVDRILHEVSEKQQLKDKELYKVDPRFEGLSEDAQLAVGLEIIRDAISDMNGRIATNKMWISTDISYKYYINKACLNLGIYSKVGYLKYEWNASEKFSNIINKIKKEVTNILNAKSNKFKRSLSKDEVIGQRQRNAREYAKKEIGLSSKQASDYIDTTYDPSQVGKHKNLGFDIKGKDKREYERITGFASYHRRRGKSRDEIYNMLISKPDRYNKNIVDALFNKKIK